MAVRNNRSPRRTAIGFFVLAMLGLLALAAGTSPVGVALAEEVTPAPSDAPTPSPAAEPTATPTPAPTQPATVEPTIVPTPTPTTEPTIEPSVEPVPTLEASATPSTSPSPSPSAVASPTISYELSPGQRDGVRTRPAFPLWQLNLPSTANGTPHSGAATIADARTCARCHAAHTGEQANLLNKPLPENRLCFTCHGAGSTFDVESAFEATNPNVDGSAIYSHATPKCTDCHNPHDASGDRPAQSTTGWTASGDIYGADGVNAAGQPIGRGEQAGTSLTYEYELCFKCHSSATALPSPNANHPSWWALDKATEFDPTNTSFHPIEAAGRNKSSRMEASLAGTSPYKKWTFTVDSTIRCTNCHADPSSLAAATQPDGYAPAHASSNRGLLIAPYRDRELKPAVDQPGGAYDRADFALCYLCHGERPFVDPNNDPAAPDTAFPVHGLHVSALTLSSGSGTSIDSAGAGPGLAICAECHFRIHSTALSYSPSGSNATEYGGLVNFAPDVIGLGGARPTWLAPSGADGSGSGSCTLTCHGYDHSGDTGTYTVAPPATPAPSP